MRINSVNNANFKGVYLVMGYNDQRKAFKEECDKYPKKLGYIQVPNNQPTPIDGRSESIFTLAKAISDTLGKKSFLLLTGEDFKKYKKEEEGYKNPDELIGRVNGLIELPLFKREDDIKDLALKHPDKYINNSFISNNS